MILVTRPAPHGPRLCAALEKEGYLCHWLPTLCFQSVPSVEIPDGCDWVVFVSPESVRQGCPLLGHQKIAAIGAGTARALEAAGYKVAACPQSHASAEALLALPEFQSVEGQRIAIIKGKGGRTLLVRTLQARGATVTEHMTYQRLCPEQAEVNLSPVHNGQVTATLITSGQGLLNLLRLVGRNGTAFLQKTPVIVISPRLARMAKRLGFSAIYRAASADAGALQEVLETLFSKT